MKPMLRAHSPQLLKHACLEPMLWNKETAWQGEACSLQLEKACGNNEDPVQKKINQLIFKKEREYGTKSDDVANLTSDLKRRLHIVGEKNG